jgi:hypothetical protein
MNCPDLEISTDPKRNPVAAYAPITGCPGRKRTSVRYELVKEKYRNREQTGPCHGGLRQLRMPSIYPLPTTHPRTQRGGWRRGRGAQLVFSRSKWSQETHGSTYLRLERRSRHQSLATPPDTALNRRCRSGAECRLAHTQPSSCKRMVQGDGPRRAVLRNAILIWYLSFVPRPRPRRPGCFRSPELILAHSTES